VIGKCLRSELRSQGLKCVYGKEILVPPTANHGLWPSHTLLLLLHLFNGLFSRTTCVNRHQKGSTVLDFTGARDDGVALALAGPCANHSHLTRDR